MLSKAGRYLLKRIKQLKYVAKLGRLVLYGNRSVSADIIGKSKGSIMKQETKAKVGIFALTLLAMSSLGITPSIGLIMAEFPDAGAMAVQQLTSIPSLMGIVSAVIFSAVAARVPRKVVAVAAPVLIAVGGLLPVVVPGGLPFLLFCSGILGLGVGLVTNTANTLITDFLPADRQEKTMSQNVVFVNLGSIFMTMGGGMLAAGGWRNNYLVYLIAVPVLVAILLFIPYRPVDSSAADGAQTERSSGASRSSLGFTAIVPILVIFAYNCLYSTFPNNVALVLIESGLGDSSTAGLVIAVGTLGGIAAGLTLGVLLKAVQRFSLAFGLTVMGVAMLALGCISSMPVVLASSFCIGYVLSIGFAQCPFVISLSASPALIPMCMGLFSAGSSIGGFVSPVLMNALSSVFMGGTATGCIVVAGILALISAFILYVTRFQAKVLDRAFESKRE